MLRIRLADKEFDFVCLLDYLEILAESWGYWTPYLGTEQTSSGYYRGLMFLNRGFGVYYTMKTERNPKIVWV